VIGPFATRIEQGIELGRAVLQFDARQQGAALGFVELAENPDRRAAMGAAGPEWIRRSFTLDDMVRRVSDVYEKAVAAYRARSGRQ